MQNETPGLPPVVNTIDETCLRLKCCRATLYKAIKAGKIKTVKFGSRRTVTENELQRVAEAGW